MLKVYGRANSINVLKGALDARGGRRKIRARGLAAGLPAHGDPEFRKINPVGVVPVIDDGDFRLRESNTIVRYLADKHGRADLYPKDSNARHHRILDGLGVDRLRQRRAAVIDGLRLSDGGVRRQGRERATRNGLHR